MARVRSASVLRSQTSGSPGAAASAGEGRLVSVLEGGYDLAALAASVAAYLRVLLDEDAPHG